MIGLLSSGRSGEHVFFRVQFAVKNGVVERKGAKRQHCFCRLRGTMTLNYFETKRTILEPSHFLNLRTFAIGEITNNMIMCWIMIS